MGRVSRWQNAMETQRELVYQQQGERCDDMFRAPFRAAGTPLWDLSKLLIYQWFSLAWVSRTSGGISPCGYKKNCTFEGFLLSW